MTINRRVLQILHNETGPNPARKTPRDFSRSIYKSFSQNSDPRAGPQLYNIEPAAFELATSLTPFRNKTPRISAGFGSVSNWKIWRAINNGRVRAVAAEGQRAAFGTQVLEDRFAPYKTLGVEDSVTFEAEAAGAGFDNLLTRASANALSNLMIFEESTILAGNTSINFGVTPTPTLATATTGGSIAAGTYNVVSVALGYHSYWDLAGLNNGATGQSFVQATSAGLQGLIVRANADGTTTNIPAGHAQPSVAASQVTTGATSTISASVNLVRGAYGFAWYAGTAGNERLAAVTSINSVVLTSIPGSGQLLSAIPGGAAVDRSASPFDYDGLLTQALASDSGAVVQSMATGAPGTGVGLTSNGAGGITEFDVILATLWDQSRASPNTIWASGRDLGTITRRILSGSTSPVVSLVRDVQDDNAGSEVTGGARATRYVNPVTGTVIEIKNHPTLPQGTIFFETEFYNGQRTYDLDLREDYLQIDWLQTTRRKDFGAYVDGVLRVGAPWAHGVLTNVAPIG